MHKGFYMGEDCPTCGTRHIIHDPTCDACGTDLKQAMPDSPKDSSQYNGALCFEFSGGYGMYIDPMIGWAVGNRNPSGIICKACADKLLAENPWLKPFLKDY